LSAGKLETNNTYHSEKQEDVYWFFVGLQQAKQLRTSDTELLDLQKVNLNSRSITSTP